MDQPKHNVTYRDTIEHDIDEAIRNAHARDRFMEAFAERERNRWPGLTCPIVHVTDEVDIPKLLRDAPVPIMVAKLTINDLSVVVAKQTMGPFTA